MRGFLSLEPFTDHDLRRTGSTLLNEIGFNSDWIEKCLSRISWRRQRFVMASEAKPSSRAVMLKL